MKTKSFFLIIISIIFSLQNLLSQNFTYYFNQRIFASNELNPARQHQCRFSFGLPIISNFYFQIRNNSISYSDLFTPMQNNQDSFYFNLDNIYQKMPEISYFPVQQYASLGFLALWIKNVYVYFSSSLFTDINIAIPRSIFTIKDGLYFENGNYFSFNNFSVKTYLYLKNSFGFSTQIYEGLTLGFRVNRLLGLAYAQTKLGFDLKISSATEDIYDLKIENLKYELQYSGPLKLKPTFDQNNIISGIDITTPQINEFDQFLNSPNYENYSALMKKIKSFYSSGWSIDIGAIYKLNDKFEFSAALLNLGYINWNTHPLKITKQNGSFTFSGFDPGKYLGDSTIFAIFKGNINLQDSIKSELLDTLLTLVNPIIDSTTFKSSLNTNLILGFGYKPIERITLGILYRGIFFDKRLYSSFSLSSTIEIFRTWSLMFSYNFFKNSYNNFGFGFSTRIWPTQVYFIMDNMSFPMLASRYFTAPNKPPDQGIATKWVKNTNYFNIQFGINFIFGCKKKKPDFGLID